MSSKICIVGGPGSGKTFLSKKIAKHLGIACYELDNIYWCNEVGNNIKREDHKRDELLNEILSKKAWLIEGTFGGPWTVPIYEQAEMIIILKIPLVIRQWRIITRFLKGKLRIEDRGKEEPLSDFLGLFRWNKKYDKKTFPGIYNYIRPFEEKVNIVTEKNPKVPSLFNSY